MIYEIIEVILAVIISTAFLFALIYNKKYFKNYLIIFIVFAVLLSVLNAFMRVFISNTSGFYSYESLIFIFIPQLAFTLFLSVKAKKRLLTAITSISNAYLSYYFLFMLKSAFLPFVTHTFTFTLIIYLSFAPLMYIYLKYIYRNLLDIIELHMPNNMFMLLLYSVSMIAEVVVYTSLTNQTSLKILRIEIFAVAIFSVYYISIFGLHYLLMQYQKQTVQITNLLSSKYEMDIILDQVSRNKENEEKQRILRHDMRHILNNISTLIKENRYSEALKMIEGYNKSVTEITSTKYCENTILNSIICYFEAKCKANNVEYIVKVNDFESQLNCPIEEVGLILSNILENAYNATIKTSNPCIKLTFLNNRGRVILQAINSYKGIIKFDNNNVPISKKEGHGVGSTSIQYYAKKNNLLVDYNIKNDTFKITVLF